MYDNDGLERSPPHLYLYLVLYSTRSWKRNNGSAGFKNQGALKFIQTKFYSHRETYSGDPRATPRRALFKVKSRTYLEVLTF
jgi:hypothetical protein